MKTQSLSPKLAFLTSLLFASSTVTAGTISQSPLFVTSSLDPNIMFIVDNSGSMNLSFIPNSIGCDTSIRNTKRAYSYYLNGLAYNPNVVYSVPLDSSGTSLGNSSFTAAWKNGYAFPRSTATPAARGARVNLSLQYEPTYSLSGTGCSDSNEYSTLVGPRTAYYYAFWSQIPSQAKPGTCTGTADQQKVDEDCYIRIDVGSANDLTPGTADEKKQNFANWYSYYRTRLLTTKAGASRAFAQLDTSPRIGYGQLNSAPGYNLEGPSFSDTIVNGVRPFSGTTTGTARYKYFDWLFKLNGSGSTPSRRAIDTAGRYYSNEGEKGPWSTTPGTSGGNIYTCRQSYTIFMTDGYWNDATATTSGARANTDGSNGPTVTHANNADTYSYVAKSPFSDSRSNTLADVAMYYWKRDICPSPAMVNNVPVSSKDPAFWQHMVLYGIGLGVPTQIDPTAAFNAIGSGATITWPDPQVNITDSGNPPVARIDDLLHASVNGHGGFFNANDTDSFVNALKSTLTAITDSSRTSASAAAANSSSLQGDTLLYVARFKPGEWYGTLTAYPIFKEPGNIKNGKIDIDNPNWEAADSLPPASERNIFTLNPGATTSPRGIEFLWNKLDPTTQQSALSKANPGATADANGEKRLNWLRGDSAFEQRNSGGIFRNRSKLLGDIVNSDPAFVGTTDYGYSALPDPEKSAYISFRSSSDYLNRTPTVYIGANDGMLHAFDARKNTGSVTTGGTELFAYIPNYLFPELSKLADPNYVHQYYVDGNTTVSDAYFGSTSGWHTLLVGSTGGGGRALYALDVTNPDSFSAENVLWEFSNSNDSDLGYTLAQSSIVRTHDTSHPWMVIVGNGYNSDNGHAVLMMIDAQTGTLVKKIDTGYAGTGSNKNGLSSPLAVDIDGDKIIDAVYAGDLYGNFWKFDLTSTSSGDWDVAYKNASVNRPLFVACTTSGTSCDNANRQPITGKPNAGPPSSDQANGIMVYFGTGKYFENGDDSVSGSQQVQTFYGIWDNNAAVTNRAELQEQSIVFEGFPTTVEGVAASRKQRILSNNAVCYTPSSPGCSESSPPKKGWALNLLEGGVNANGERVVSYPLVRHGFVIFASIIPDPDPCVGGGRGWLMEVGAFTGGRTNISPFDVNGDGLVNDADKVTSDNAPVATSGMDFGIGLHDTFAVIEDTTAVVDYKYASGSSGVGDIAEYQPPILPSDTPLPPVSSGRRAWRQLR